MSTYDLISANQPGTWNRVLERCGRFDSYHLLGYHLVAREHGEGEPYLFVFEDQGRCAALPLLLNPVAQVDGLSDSPDFDATSVYGYPGPISSVDPSDRGADEFRLQFQVAFLKAMDELHVVAFFARENPIINSSWLFAPIVDPTALGPTVAVDLTQPEEEQFRDYRRDHRRDVRQARRKGMVVREDPNFDRIEVFLDLYVETMDRTQAAAHYYFPLEYFLNLKRHLGDSVKLYFSELGGDVISAAMFLFSADVIQYHLSGTATSRLKCRGGVKLILDHVRRWGTQNGFRWFHLGGGTGAQQDSLFQFKAGFSNRLFQYRTFRCVFRPTTYRELVRRRQNRIGPNGLEGPTGDYFPAYRQTPYAARAA
ncbi:MAG: GNAT family N-acetyltransferase [Planctomycetes bacterium]|nr:GNAT family N-acetyltransferase [Planctomycetota bacterium]